MTQIKAYEVSCNEACELVAATTPGRAKHFALRSGEWFHAWDPNDYIHLRAHRQPLADGYVQKRGVEGVVHYDEDHPLFKDILKWLPYED